MKYELTENGRKIFAKALEIKKRDNVSSGKDRRGIFMANDDTSCGMTLRDYFAGQVLGGIIHRYDYNERDAKRSSNVAYMFADAMLAEREKE